MLTFKNTRTADDNATMFLVDHACPVLTPYYLVVSIYRNLWYIACVHNTITQQYYNMSQFLYCTVKETTYLAMVKTPHSLYTIEQS